MNPAPIGIAGIGVYLPEGRETAAMLVERAGEDATQVKFLNRVHKLYQIPITAPGEKLQDMLVKSMENLFASVGKLPVDWVFYAHSMLPQAPCAEAPLRQALAHVGLGEVPAMGISQLNCVSGFGALNAAWRFLRRHPEKRALLLAADHTAFLPQTRLVHNITMAGDSATALFFDCQSARQRLLAVHFDYDTRFHQGCYENESGRRVFAGVYIPCLRRTIEGALAKAGITHEQVALIIPHNVNLSTWRQYARETGFAMEKIFTDRISEIGHSYCGDFALNLSAALTAGKLKTDDPFLAVSVGIGSYFAAAVFRN